MDSLKTLYESTNGDNWINRSGWDVIIDNRTTPPSNCDLGILFGIDLNNVNRVTLVELGINQLNGTIPKEIEKLDNLTELYLQRNQLSGSIPKEIGNLLNLNSISLNNNQLTGEIPNEIGNLFNLSELYLHFNQLSSSIPASIGNLTNLFVLHLNNNQLIGNIPVEFSDLTSLVWLYLNNNQLNGHIPSTFGNLNNLIYLVANQNNLSGCYSTNLLSLCTQLNSQGFDGNSNISDGNNFEASWEDFCNLSMGACILGCTDPCAANYDPNADVNDNSCNPYPINCNEDCLYGDIEV